MLINLVNDSSLMAKSKLDNSLKKLKYPNSFINTNISTYILHRYFLYFFKIRFINQETIKKQGQHIKTQTAESFYRKNRHFLQN